MKKIYRYKILLEAFPQAVFLPVGGIPRYFSCKEDGPGKAFYVWAEVDPNQVEHYQVKYFQIFATGERIPDMSNYIGTTIDGWFVWHLYQVHPKEEDLKMQVFLDDVRPCPEGGWTLVKNAEDCLAVLRTGKVDIVSLDHDLGENEKTGYDVLKWIEETTFTDEKYIPPLVIVHSMNPVGAKVMREVASKLNLIRQQRRDHE